MDTRPRAHLETPHKVLIILTLVKLRNQGITESSLHSTAQKLRHLDRNTNLMNPEQVKDYIANKNVTNATKQKLANIYGYFCKANNLEYTPPRYKYETKIPLIPSTANIDKIISASSKKYATIFTILKETGVEGRELATTTRNDIDAEQGIINVQGCKGHNSRSLKLKPKTADMLKAYLDIHKGENRFRNPNEWAKCG